ncbi:6282_t:CDS:2 [Racocetra persica]|uniref:6282_t:CDS:1 n=1 Tax=Racocetra persica TaxID=160502 RepID=A0ACA9RKE3_9GLOM|nr:6282_t:CDS:2 [Racocetra persica]
MNDKENQASQPIASELKISGVLNTSAEAIANIPRSKTFVLAVVRTYRRLGQPNQKKAITQPEIAKIIEAFLAEIQASLLAGEVITLRNHFSLEVETSPTHRKFNPLQPDQTIIRPELKKIKLRLSQA